MKKDRLFNDRLIWLKYYSDARNLVAWLSNKRPSMLENIYDAAFSEEEFNKYKEYKYESYLNLVNGQYNNLELDKGREQTIKNYSQIFIGSYHGEYIDTIYERKDKLKNKEIYLSDIKIPIANFTYAQEKWLKWHCPLDFVREQLKNDLGLKDYWYYKLFFKY